MTLKKKHPANEMMKNDDLEDVEVDDEDPSRGTS